MLLQVLYNAAIKRLRKRPEVEIFSAFFKNFIFLFRHLVFTGFQVHQRGGLAVGDGQAREAEVRRKGRQHAFE